MWAFSVGWWLLFYCRFGHVTQSIELNAGSKRLRIWKIQPLTVVSSLFKSLQISRVGAFFGGRARRGHNTKKNSCLLITRSVAGGCLQGGGTDVWRIGKGRYQGQNVLFWMTAGICGASFRIRQWCVFLVFRCVFLVKWCVSTSTL